MNAASLLFANGLLPAGQFTPRMATPQQLGLQQLASLASGGSSMLGSRSSKQQGCPSSGVQAAAAGLGLPGIGSSLMGVGDFAADGLLPWAATEEDGTSGTSRDKGSATPTGAAHGAGKRLRSTPTRATLSPSKEEEQPGSKKSKMHKQHGSRRKKDQAWQQRRNKA